VVGSCEHSYELSCSIKCGQFLDKLSDSNVSSELCSTELVISVQSEDRRHFKTSNWVRESA
jgi:hypothetical protein